jgi:poly-D-alanine transfer protein DltD
LDENEIPYLNMYVDNKVAYEPGLLNDIMHFGDLGWMKINNFLNNLYNEP